jgi:hypothetical protein
MNRNLLWLAGGVAICAAAGLLLCRAEALAAGDKGPLQPILPKEVYQELAKREAELIREQLGGMPKEQAVSRAKFGAVLIAALTMSAKDGAPAEELRGTRETALSLASALNKKDQAAAKQLAAQLPNAKGDPGAKSNTINWGTYLKLGELMDHFDVKSKGGDGIHPDLQTNIRFKGALNGVEAKIGELAKKELSAANLKKEAKELELLGYQSAVVGSLAYYYAPSAKQGKKDPQQWRSLSLAMRDQSVSLAVAAQKGDPALVLKASSDLSSTCTQCHSVFK